jgi:hypothetical protein
MPLTLRPTGLASPAQADRQDWTVFEDGRPISRFYCCTKRQPPSSRSVSMSRSGWSRVSPPRRGECGGMFGGIKLCVFGCKVQGAVTKLVQCEEKRRHPVY